MPTLRVELRPYQLEALAWVEQKLSQGITRQAISAPTGAGKTILFAELIRRRQRLGRALVLAHRDELVQQAIDKIKCVIPNANVGKVKAESNELNAQIIVGSVQTLAKDSRLLQLLPNFQTIVVDEAHHVTANSYQKILTYFGCFSEKPPLLLGVSATLERTDGLGLGNTFQEVVFEINILELIEKSYLVDIEAQQITLKGVDFDTIEACKGDIADAELSELMEKANAPWQVAEAFSRYACDRKAIVFTPSVKLAHDTAASLRNAGFSAEALDGSIESENRRAILGRLKSGETQVVTNCSVLTEGFDETSINCVVLARPTQSKSLFIQMVGRGLRVHPGKTNCLVLDCTGNSNKHELVSIPSLLGLNHQAQEVSSISSVASVLELRKKQGLEFINGQLVSKTVDLFAFRRRKQSINWLTVSPQCHAISIGNGNLLIIHQQYDHSWSIYALVDKVIEQVNAGLDLEMATSLSEDMARIHASRLIDTTAGWRNRPPTDRQLIALAKFGVANSPGLTSGQASDLIGLHIAQRQLKYVGQRQSA